MKKLICMLLLTTMMLSLLSCLDNSDNSSGNASSASDNNSSSSANTVTNSSDDDKNTDPSDEDEDDESGDKTPSDTETPDNEKSNLVACLETLLTGYKWDPKSFIPDKLRPEYEPNLLSSKQTNDYSDFVSVSDIQKNGIGEQWNMVTENLSEAQIFFTVLSAVDNLSTVSVTVFNNYIDDNPADTAHYEFKEGVYSVTIHCTENTIDYVIDYTASIPKLGEQSIQIALSMNTET